MGRTQCHKATKQSRQSAPLDQMLVAAAVPRGVATRLSASSAFGGCFLVTPTPSDSLSRFSRPVFDLPNQSLCRSLKLLPRSSRTPHCLPPLMGPAAEGLKNAARPPRWTGILYMERLGEPILSKVRLADALDESDVDLESVEERR